MQHNLKQNNRAQYLVQKIEQHQNSELNSQVNNETKQSFLNTLEGGTRSLVSQFLHPVSQYPAKLKIYSVHAARIIVPKQSLILCGQFGCRRSLSFTDQETQEENFRVESAPLWASSYTHLLYKAQDPFSL